MRSLRVLLCASWLGVLGCSGATGSGSDSLTEVVSLADLANARLDVQSEERYLRQGLTLSGPDRERVKARMNLARLRWKFYRDFDEAATLLGEATAIGAEEVMVWAGRAAMERSRKDFVAAAEAAGMAVKLASRPFEEREAVMALSAAVAGGAAQGRFASEPTDPAALLEALELQRALVRSQPGDHDAAKLMLTLAVLLSRPDDAREAWRAYYHVTKDDPGPGLVVEPGRRLEALYGRRQGASSMSPEARADLLGALSDALSDSCFYLEAALVVLDARGPERDRLLQQPRTREIVAYARFCRRVRELSDEFYRLTSLGQAEPDRYQRQLAAAAAELWPELDNPSSRPPSGSPSSFNAAINHELAPRFGTQFGSLSKRSLSFGHATSRETRRVEQYGRGGSVTYTVLDHMVSNGYTTWAWNETSVGGWATANSIVSVRSSLLREVVDIWNLYSSPRERALIEEKIRTDTVADDDRARKKSVTYLPGLHFRMALEAVEGVVARLKSQGVADEDLRLAFIKELRRVGDESAIFAHEGRHAIDLKLDASQKSPELEFTAKLSEVAFSSEPRFSILGILGPSLGDGTPHGRANLKFAEGAVAWMAAHEAEIEGFDPSRPHFPQLDLLTDEQLIAVARSMDPLVKR